MQRSLSDACKHHVTGITLKASFGPDIISLSGTHILEGCDSAFRSQRLQASPGADLITIIPGG